MKNFSLYIVTDPHYFENKLGASGPAYERRSRTDQKCIAETGAIIDAGFQKIAADKETNVVVLPGDLVYRAEKASHLGFIEKLRALQKQGKEIYVLTARHDYCNDGNTPCGFVGEEEIPAEGTRRDELRGLYYDFGFKQAISEHLPTLSYVVQLTDGIRLLVLNCDGDGKDFKGFYDDQMAWALEQIRFAHESGNYIFATTHYPLLPGSPVMRLIGDAKLTDWEKRANELADAGLDLIFTGHMHMQSLTQYTTQNGNTITDVCTGSFVGCPCAYRKVTFSDTDIHIESFTIEDFDWDKQGKTAAEYFTWRFDRMITDIIDAMAYDFAFFTRLFGGPEKNKKLKIPVTLVGKILQKLTLGGVGRLFLFRVDPSIKDRLLKDTAVEFVRNIFVGNEPYVPGTPMYAAVDALLLRLRPVLRIAEKKLGAKNPMFADLRGFVLSLIGDEKQLDYEAALPFKSYQKQGGDPA